jgi:hypothetical protein
MRVSLFRVLAGVAAVVALGFFVAGAWFVLDDLEQSGEMFDGLGAVIGAGLMLVASLAGVMAVLAIRLVRRRPMVSRVLGVLLALTGLGILYPLGVDSSSAWWLVLPLPLGLLVVSLLPDARDPGRDADVPGWGRADR